MGAKSQYTNLGKMFREYREAKGLTQSQVASLLGYSSPQFVSNAERGLCRLPFEAISQLVKLYELDPEMIIEYLVRQHEEYYRKVFKKELASRARTAKSKSRK